MLIVGFSYRKSFGFFGLLLPDWGNTTELTTAGSGSSGLKVLIPVHPHTTWCQNGELKQIILFPHSEYPTNLNMSFDAQKILIKLV